MKKIFLTAITIILITGALLIPQSTISAQVYTPTPPPTTATPVPPAAVPNSQTSAQVTEISPFPVTPGIEQLERGENISFRVLDTNDVTMIGPYSSYFLDVGIPSHWKMNKSSKLTLNVNLNITRAPNQQGNYGAWLGPRLDVFFDDVFLTSLRVMDNGDYTFDIPLPVDQLKPARSGAHFLYLYLDATYDCEYDQSSVLTIKADSYFSLPHETAKLSPNLNNLPVPFFQRSSFVPNQVALVVPDNASESELQAALTVAAGFGRMTTDNLQLAAMPLGQVTDAIRKSSQLIYVGKAASFPALSSETLPAPSDGKQFKATGAGADDGILQIVASKTNPDKVIMVVGGNSDAGVIKAAKAVSTGAIRANQNAQMAIISDVVPGNVVSTNLPVDRTFASLGYENITLQGLGFVNTQISFTLPGGFSVGPDAYLDFAFAHSGLLDLERTSISAILNDVLVNSIAYSDETSKGDTTPYRFNLPAYAFVPGVNTLILEANHVNKHCAYYTTGEMWTTIYNKSLLHIPPASPTEKRAVLPNFANYPRPLSDDPDLTSVAFLVGKNDPGALFTAVKIAEDLGRQTTSGIVNLSAYFSDKVPDDVKKGKSLILVGKANDLPILSELSASLPAPFKSGSNMADESGLSVSYRIPPETSIGYLEIMKSPWNENQIIMAALGSTAEGLKWAAAALTDPIFVTQLNGNYAVTNGAQVFTVDTKAGSGTMNIGVTAAPGMAVTVTPAVLANVESNLAQAVPTKASPFQIDPKIWIPYAIAVISIITILVIIIVVSVNARRRRDEKFRIDRS